MLRGLPLGPPRHGAGPPGPIGENAAARLRRAGAPSRFSFTQLAGLTPTFGKDPETLRREGWTTAEGVLASAHDAARAHRGGDWRMPTKRELEALREECDWTWTATNGVRGFVVRGSGDYAGNAIFLPATGLGCRTGLTMPNFGDLYASDPRTDAVPCSWRLEYGPRDANGTGVKVNMDYRWDRFLAALARPVRDAAE